jgi:hypothetical protein
MTMRWMFPVPSKMSYTLMSRNHFSSSAWSPSPAPCAPQISMASMHGLDRGLTARGLGHARLLRVGDARSASHVRRAHTSERAASSRRPTFARRSAIAA